MDAAFEIFRTRLNELINTISAMNHMLKTDQSLLSKNDIQGMAASDDKKQQLLNEMSQQALQLRNSLPVKQHGESASSLEIYLNHLNKPEAEQAAALIQTLQNKLAEGYQYLVSNNNVVTANLSYMKDIWDRLSGLAFDKNAVYEKPSSTSK